MKTTQEAEILIEHADNSEDKGENRKGRVNHAMNLENKDRRE